MNNVLENYKKYPGLTEVYEVVKTAEVVHNRRIFRIEVLKCYSNPPGFDEVRCWKYESVILQQSDMTGGKFDREPEDVRVLIKTSLPDVHAGTPESALREALHFLTER